MKYLEIFNAIIEIMKNDSSTCKDMGIKDHEKYRRMISDDMEEKEFTKTVKKYIASFGVPAHLNFSDNNMTGLNFDVMRYNDALYVIDAAKEANFKKADKIIALDGKSISEIAEDEFEFLMGEKEERQGFLWSPILLFSNIATIERDGKVLEVSIHSEGCTYENKKYYINDMGNNTLLLRLADFADEDAIRQVYADNSAALDTCENLIIDVRGNGGGADTAYLPLLEYCFPEGRKIADFDAETYGMEINYSKRNCDSRTQMINQFFGEEIPDEVKPVIDQMLAELKENSGKGFITSEAGGESGMIGKKNPQKVYIITDERCGSSGDAFVETMSCSPKVTIVGRPSMGITDYSNCTMECFDQFQLVYPTSRAKRIDAGKGILHKGVPVDVYIPWTPEHLEKDIDLEYIINRLGTVLYE